MLNTKYVSTYVYIMEFIKELGTLALGSRIKTLSETLMRDIAKVYKEQDADFEPRWFTFFQLMLQKKELTVTQIAHELNQTHPAVVQIINALKKKELIISTNNKTDKRKSFIKLSEKGKVLAKELIPLWEIVQIVTNEILSESAPDFLDKIAILEKSLQHKSTYQRINEKIIQKTIDHVEFIEYDEKYFKDFQQLNEHWVKSYLELTEHDRQILSNPVNEIINKEGKIFLLTAKEEVIGTYALQKVSNKVCELQKFTIKEKYRGLKLGKRMLDNAIENALKQKYSTILLFTTPELKEATNLYKNKGFEDITSHPEFIDKTGRHSLCMQLNIHE